MDLANLRVVFSHSGLAQIEGDARRSFDSISRSVGISMTAVGAAITGALGMFSKSAMNFESALRNIGTLGVTNLGELRNGVLDFSVAMGQDAVESTMNLYEIISAGIPEDNALAVLESASKGAAAGVGTVQDAMQLGLAVLNAYNLEVSRFDDIMGQAATAVNYGTTTIGQMGHVIGRLAPVAAQAGVSIEELFSAIAGITVTGLQTHEAISGLRQGLMNVIKPSADAQSLAQALGIEFDVTAMKAKGLTGFMADLVVKVEEGSKELGGQKKILEQFKGEMEANAAAAQERLKVLTQEIPMTQEAIKLARAQGEATKALEDRLKALKEEQKGLKEQAKGYGEQLKDLKEKYKGLENVSEDTLMTMGALFGSVEGLNAMMALTSERGGAVFQKSMEEMKTAGANLNEIFERWKAQNPELAYKQAKAALAAMGIEIGTVLLPVLAELAKAFVPIAKWVATLIHEHPQLAKAVITAVGAFGLFNLTLGPLVYKLPGLIGMFQALSGIQLAGTLSGAASAMGGLGSAVAGVSGALAFLLPLIAVVATAVLFTIPMLYAAGKAFIQWRQAVDQQRQSEEALNLTIGERVSRLEQQGIAIDRAKLTAMDYNQQILYLNELERNSQDAVLMKHLETVAGKEAAQAHFVVAKNLLLNQEIMLEEAAALALMNLSDELKMQLMQGDAAYTQQMLETMGIRTASSLDAAQVEQNAARETVAAQEQAMSGMRGMATNLTGVTQEFQGNVQRRTQAVTGFMETMTAEGERSVEDMSNAGRTHLERFEEGAQESFAGAEEAVYGMNTSFAQVPQVAGQSMSDTAQIVRTYADQMCGDLERVVAAMGRMDANARHSPSVNDRVRSGLESMSGLFGSYMSDIQRLMWETQEQWAGEWPEPRMPVMPQVGGGRQAAGELGRQYTAMSQEPEWPSFAQRPLLGPVTPRVAPSEEGTGRGSVTVQIAKLVVSNALDVEEVINEIARG